MSVRDMLNLLAFSKESDSFSTDQIYRQKYEELHDNFVRIVNYFQIPIIKQHQQKQS